MLSGLSSPLTQWLALLSRSDYLLRGLRPDRRPDGSPGQADGGLLPHPERDHNEDGLHHHVVSRVSSLVLEDWCSAPYEY